MPSRIAILLIVFGFRAIVFAASSSDFEARASPIKSRCSAIDQLDAARTPLPNNLPRDLVPMRAMMHPAGDYRQAAACGLRWMVALGLGSVPSAMLVSSKRLHNP
jgi:hypothetical protein